VKLHNAHVCEVMGSMVEIFAK